MRNLILLLLLVFQNEIIFLTAAENEEKCSFEKTVNLTNCDRYENGTYMYQEILIPPEKQQLYTYELKFEGRNISVPSHLRGCVCDERPCMKLCCAQDEYLEESNYTAQCEKLTEDMNISWDLIVRLRNGKERILNIFKHFTQQEGLPCERPEALVEEDEAILQENGLLLFQVTNSRINTLDYCYSPKFDNDTEKYILTPFTCATENVISWELLLNTYAMAISVVFLIPTILVYMMLKELRGNLRGKLLICYLFSLTMGYTILAFINISAFEFSNVFCSFLGFTCYFFSMSAFLWLSVLCFDIWKNFKETNVEFNSRKNRTQFFVYSLYAWLTAGVATCFLIYVQHSPRIDNIYKPGIGTDMCWMNSYKWSAAIYFYGPNLIILLFNFVTFAHLTKRIYKVRRNLAKMTHKEKFFQENGVVILRLFLIMGISWLFDILSYCLHEHEEWHKLFVISDFCNAIQGILIFSLFVLKPNVLNLLKKRFNKGQTGKSGRAFSWTNTHFSRLQTSTSMTSAITP